MTLNTTIFHIIVSSKSGFIGGLYLHRGWNIMLYWGVVLTPWLEYHAVISTEDAYLRVRVEGRGKVTCHQSTLLGGNELVNRVYISF